MNICIIPARGGSKRIPKKNIKDFHGKPLISYSIETALKSKVFDDVIVSSDDDEIIEVALKFGANVPFVRPKELSDDFSTTSEVIKDILNKIHYGCDIQTVCCLYATAPLLDSSTFTKAYFEFLKQGCDFLFSACEFEFPIQRAIKITDDKSVEMFYPEYFSTRSQDLEKSYHDAGQFYFGKKDAWLFDKPIFANRSKVFLLPRNLVCDIDTLDDFEFAKKLYKINYAI